MPRSPLPSGPDVPRPSSAISRVQQRLAPPQYNVTATGIGVTYNVGDRLAQGEGQHRLLLRAQRHGVSITLDGNTSGFQCGARAGQLGEDAVAAISADGLTHISQRSAGGVFDIQHLLLGTLRIAVHQFARQFGLEGNERQGMSEHVVQVAGNSLPFGNLSEMFDFVVSDSKLELRAVADGPMMVAKAHESNQQEH